jgi:hypothetical protein
MAGIYIDVFLGRGSFVLVRDSLSANGTNGVVSKCLKFEPKKVHLSGSLYSLSQSRKKGCPTNKTTHITTARPCPGGQPLKSNSHDPRSSSSIISETTRKSIP